MPSQKVIIYVPGMKPKPPPQVHREALWRCVCEGVRRADPRAAESLAQQPDVFQVASWAALFYDEQRDYELE